MHIFVFFWIFISYLLDRLAYDGVALDCTRFLWTIFGLFGILATVFGSPGLHGIELHWIFRRLFGFLLWNYIALKLDCIGLEEGFALDLLGNTTIEKYVHREKGSCKNQNSVKV